MFNDLKASTWCGFENVQILGGITYLGKVKNAMCNDTNCKKQIFPSARCVVVFLSSYLLISFLLSENYLVLLQTTLIDFTQSALYVEAGEVLHN